MISVSSQFIATEHSTGGTIENATAAATAGTAASTSRQPLLFFSAFLMKYKTNLDCTEKLREKELFLYFYLSSVEPED